MSTEDGSVQIGVRMNVSKAEKDLARLKEKIDKMAAGLDKDTGTQSALEKKLTAAKAEAERTAETIKDLKFEIARFNELSKGTNSPEEAEEYMYLAARHKEVTEELANQEGIYEKQVKEIDKLDAEHAKLAQSIEAQRKALEAAENKAGTMEQALEVERNAGEGTEALKNRLAEAQKSITSFVGKTLRITSAAILFRKAMQYIASAVAEFAKHDAETQEKINGLKASLAAMKASWGAAFAPILNAVIPVLNTLIGWLTSAANAVARFIAVVSGKGSFKKAVANANQLKSGYGGVASAAEEARLALMGFDEINKLDDNSSGGGGGGGGAGPGYDFIEEMIDGTSWIDKIGMKIRDVFFDWSDLSPHQIFDKVLVGLSFVTGLALAGVPGAIVGTLVGLGLTLLIDQLFFDEDGNFDPKKAKESLYAILIAAAGGAIGFALGGPLGAAIGATATLGLWLLMEKILPKLGIEGENAEELKTKILKAVCTFGGAALGFTLGGPLGAALGAVVGLGVSVAISNLDFEEAKEKKTAHEWIVYIFHDLLGLPTDQQILQYGKDFVGNFWKGLTTGESENGEGGLGEELHILFVDPVKQALEDIKALFGEDGPLSGIAEKVKSFLDFEIYIPMPHLDITWQPIQSNFLKNLLGTDSWPDLSISWYARGGIVDGATLIGAGEAGKEAIIPLERNTEWITMVARGIVDYLTNGPVLSQIARAMASTPLPAVATGMMVPPNAVSRGNSISDIADMLNELRMALQPQGTSNNNIEAKLYLDGYELHTRMKVYERREERANG